MTGRLGSGLLTARVSDHLPVFVTLGGDRDVGGVGGPRSKRRLINEARIKRFADELGVWDMVKQGPRGLKLT